MGPERGELLDCRDNCDLYAHDTSGIGDEGDNVLFPLYGWLSLAMSITPERERTVPGHSLEL